MELVRSFVPIIALSIPIIVIILGHLRRTQENRIKELELQRAILELEVKKQNGQIRLLEEENKKMDKVIYEN